MTLQNAACLLLKFWTRFVRIWEDQWLRVVVCFCTYRVEFLSVDCLFNESSFHGDTHLQHHNVSRTSDSDDVTYLQLQWRSVPRAPTALRTSEPDGVGYFVRRRRYVPPSPMALRTSEPDGALSDPVRPLLVVRHGSFDSQELQSECRAARCIHSAKFTPEGSGKEMEIPEGRSIVHGNQPQLRRRCSQRQRPASVFATETPSHLISTRFSRPPCLYDGRREDVHVCRGPFHTPCVH